MLQPFFSYYGSKWNLAAAYPPPEHGLIIEPFAGSACYALHYPRRDVLLIDKYPVICAIWEYLIGVSEAEILALPDVPEGGTVDDVDVCQEARWLIGLLLTNAAASPQLRSTPFGRDPQNFAWSRKARSRIARQLHVIRHWRVLCGDYTDAPDVAATWFVDPPYELAGKHYKHGAKAIDFAHLATWSRSRQGQVIVCENEGATWLPFEPFAVIDSAMPGRKSREVVWTQGCERMVQGVML